VAESAIPRLIGANTGTGAAVPFTSPEVPGSAAEVLGGWVSLLACPLVSVLHPTDGCMLPVDVPHTQCHPRISKSTNMLICCVVAGQ
jgi:hypothetical protein